MVFTFNDSHLSFYVNGKLQQLVSKNFKTNYLISDSVVIGNTASKKNDRWTRGVFDDIQIFHRVLSAREIEELYNAPNPNKLKNILYEGLKYGVFILILIIVIIIFIHRGKRNLRKQKEQFELLNKITELELKVVKAQMNPHFISNCLSAIQELIYKNEIEKAVQYIAKFSYFLRQILNFSDVNFISVSEEIEIIKLNVELEKLRFKNDFEFQLIISENFDTNDILIPALITQPFIENAIWHGLLPLKEKRKAKLTINMFIENGLPIIEIEDNGVGRDLINLNKSTSKGTNLINVKMDSLNRLNNTLNYKIEIIDMITNNNDKIGTKIKIHFDNIKE